MKSNFFIMASALLLFAACSNEELITQNDREPIRFRTAMSRAAEMNLQGLQKSGFNVSAVWNKQLYFDGVGYSYSGGKWAGNAVHYWPKGEDLPVEFFAYSPGSVSSNMSINGESQTMRSFSPNTSIEQQVDFITAFQSGTKEVYGKTDITLMFRHRLSQIIIAAKRNINSDGYKFEVKAARIGNVSGTGDLVLPKDKFLGEGLGFETDQNEQAEGSIGGWTASDNATTYSTSEYDPIIIDHTGNNLMGSGGNAMLIPQTLKPWDLKRGGSGAYVAVLLRITYDNGTPGGFQVFPFDNMKDGKELKQYAWAAMPISGTWEPNKKYKYTLIFDMGAGYVAPTEPNSDEVGDEAEKILQPISMTVDVEPWEKEAINTDLGEKATVTLNQTSAELTVGESISLEVKEWGAPLLTWTSNKPEVATVDKNGKITAVSLGEATITAALGSITATCEVKVVPTKSDTGSGD